LAFKASNIVSAGLKYIVVGRGRKWCL